jgi:hypothetical protein
MTVWSWTWRLPLRGTRNNQASLANLKRQMKKASLTEAKNRLSALIDGLKSGPPVLIVSALSRLERVATLDVNGVALDERLAGVAGKEGFAMVNLGSM